MKKNETSPLWWFTLLFLAAMFLPRLVTQGMFGDGLLYASLARNLAEGRGSLWAPWFSSGYWLEFASGSPYFENPPLMIWLQSGFFYLFGDHWWVEKLYSLLFFALNAWLIVKVWEIPLRGTGFQGKFGWLPLLLWYFITPVVWGNPNNLMDNNLLIFCLLALWAVFDALFSKKQIWLKMTLAGLFIYLGLMTKGPVALYPAAAPFLFALIFEKRKWVQGMLRSIWVGTIAVGLFVLMLFFIPESRTYFENYWDKRLGVVLSGVREDAELTGWARFSIFKILLTEQVGLIVIFLLLLWFGRRKIGIEGRQNIRKISFFFLMLGLSASLPLMLSARQSGMYLIPGLPMFALFAGYFHLPLIRQLLLEPLEKMALILKKLRSWSWVGIVVLGTYLVFLFGKPGREKALLVDLPYIQKSIPRGEKVAVCEQLMSDLHAHTYLQRFHHLELSRDFSNCRYALTTRICDEEVRKTLLENGFEKIEGQRKPSTGKPFNVYSKNPL